ncbi:cryptochrome/photolyase family protein [Spongiivirga citrea]|uniref:Deoxyribodipyrimidine photo-lyase n=1 Tax=Spongiivirga citrea TaxID=1481457 RepID=A0A6M0CHV8_9FLAO|nr:deoxyribodipyrimidine photo-lyase [Spongiivirga citrea]NER17455.1 deoxyribodipyrimidine photo-lyase [Spongiivirga citrea]
MADKIVIFWFRRDLRFHDNVGLLKALESGFKVLPIFIFDKSILDELPVNDSRVSFIHETITNLNDLLQSEYQSGIAQYYGTPDKVYSLLAKEYNIVAVYTNHDYEPYARKRDQEIKAQLNDFNIQFHTFKDQVIYEKSEVVKDDGSPYAVYTPYMRKWKNLFRSTPLIQFNSEQKLNNAVQGADFPSISLQEMGFETATIRVAPYKLNPNLIETYKDTRNYPAKDSTSKLGPHLRFGTVSVREVVKKAIAQKNEIFWNELIWREFFMQILWHHPHTVNSAYKSKYDRIEWRNNKTEFEQWKKGETGYPLVDAAMRQLNETGFMHNRVRMLVGSFLCKHLLIDWRWGEAYFALKLHDYDQSSNVGNWQWVAGCGVDAAPYFRIFNPSSQIDKFDKQHEFINRWVKDLNELTYPSPIVDHKFARERCLRVYKEALT